MMEIYLYVAIVNADLVGPYLHFDLSYQTFFPPVQRWW